MSKHQNTYFLVYFILRKNYRKQPISIQPSNLLLAELLNWRLHLREGYTKSFLHRASIPVLWCRIETWFKIHPFVFNNFQSTFYKISVTNSPLHVSQTFIWHVGSVKNTDSHYSRNPGYYKCPFIQWYLHIALFEQCYSVFSYFSIFKSRCICEIHSQQ